MSAPASYGRVYAAIKWLMPKGLPAWEDDASAILREMSVIGWVVGRIADRVDAMREELFPDGALETLSRWEALFRIPTRFGDSTATRQTRLAATVGCVAGNTLAKLASLLAPLFDTAESNVAFIEVCRAQLDAALTVTTGVIAAAVPTTKTFTQWWPGVVDEFGVHVYIALSAAVGVVARLTAPDGSSWVVPVSGVGGWYETRTTFLGKPAGGEWKLTITGGVVNLTEFRLLVSNDVDAAQIYRFYVRRDAGLVGSADLIESQRILRKTVVAHYKSLVCERSTMVVDDTRSLSDRDPVGV